VKIEMKYDGDEVVVGIGTSVANATSALTTAPITNLESITYKVDQSIAEVAKGIGSRLTEVYEHLIKYTGTITRWVDEVATSVSGGTGSLATNVGAFSGDVALTPLYVAIKNKTTSSVIMLCGCIGLYSEDLKSPDGFLMETWDFKFSSITRTP
jgi:phage-related protein